MAKKVQVDKQNVALQTLKIEYVAIDSVKPNDYNPNRQSEHDFELLCKSIDEDGMTQPVVVLRKDNVIVDGEHRWRACKALGFEQVPVVFTDMTPAQARIATLRHNRARGEEDVELAAAVLRDLVSLGATDWVKDSLNLDEVELSNFLEAVDKQDGMSTEEAEKLAEADDSTLREMVKSEGGSIDEHQSVSVQDVIRAREKRLREAKNEQEKADAAREIDVYRLRLVFTGEQAVVVRRVLGKKPIERLLEICKSRKSA
jgi:ParB/RepB/Spo0J family partition protein